MTTVRVEDPVVGWQEIDEADTADEHAAVRRSFRRGYDHAGWATAVPISVPSPLRIREQRVTKVCDGRAGVTPARVVVRALLDVPELTDWPAWWHLNGHLPYRAPDLWTQAHNGWRREVHELDRRTIVTTRDTNHHGPMPKLDVLERALLAPAGIDKITTVPGRLSRRLAVELLDQRTVDLAIDGHNARGVKLRLVQPETRDEVILWVVTANIGRGVPQRVARANIALVRRGFRVRQATTSTRVAGGVRL